MEGRWRMDPPVVYGDLMDEESVFEQERRRTRKWLRRLGVFCGALLGVYHAEHCLADEPITGSASDGQVSIHWEYDLQAGVGHLEIWNEHVYYVVNNSRFLYFEDLLPKPLFGSVWGSRASNAQLDCDADGERETDIVRAALPYGLGTRLDFELPEVAGDEELAVIVRDIDYGWADCDFGSCSGAALCALMNPLSTLSGFVSVQPIARCVAADLDCDGDVDLADYNQFMLAFTGPVPGDRNVDDAGQDADAGQD